MYDNKYRVFIVEMPYPAKNKQKVRMVGMKLDHKHPIKPYFFATDIAKLFHMKQKDVLTLAVPHVTAISNTKVIGFRGYVQVCMFGDTKYNKNLQHIITKWANEELTDLWSTPYLKILSGGIHNGKCKYRKSSR